MYLYVHKFMLHAGFSFVFSYFKSKRGKIVYCFNSTYQMSLLKDKSCFFPKLHCSLNRKNIDIKQNSINDNDKRLCIGTVSKGHFNSSF